jgi:imidazoleglycerol-phosphate dehydratase
MSNRTAEIKRNTSETNIELKVNLDGKGQNNINTSIAFLDHMLVLFSKHSKIDLDIIASGDTQIDDHHTVEDIGICLGDALKEALGDKKGIKRYGNFALPMDETLVETALDISGRPYLIFNVESDEKTINKFDTNLIEDFFRALTNRLALTIHINLKYGKGAHHIFEAVFKSFAVALRDAVAVDSDDIPSSKGIID